MRTIWSIVITAVLLLSHIGSATAGGLIAAGWMPDDCDTHLAEQDRSQSKGCNDVQKQGQKQDAGHCQCACHIAPQADVVHLTVQIVPGSRALSVPKMTDEIAKEGPVIGIDHPPQLV